jgi:phosphate uptake regulator
MRTTFQQRLDGLEAKLGQMGQVLRSQLDRTLTALATADADVADEVIRRDRLLDADYVEVETCGWSPVCCT